MLMIRLARAGRKNTASFRIVLQEKTKATKSSAQEILGSYNPHLKNREDQISLKVERIQYWMSKGAQTSATVHNMLVEKGIISEPKRRSVQPKKKPTAEGEGGVEAESAPATPAQ